jgi:molybdopterin molybdotransferase
MPDADVRMRGFMEKTDLDAALEILRSLIEPLGAESVRLEQALGRTLAQGIISSEEVPSFDKSAMDGYALRAAETFGASPTDPVSFTVIGEVLPGEVGDFEVGPGEAVRIMTGGAFPKGADAVLMAEYATDRGDVVQAHGSVVPGRNVARAGEDIQKGDTVLERGRVVRPQDIGVLASIRRVELKVTRARGGCPLHRRRAGRAWVGRGRPAGPGGQLVPLPAGRADKPDRWHGSVAGHRGR